MNIKWYTMSSEKDGNDIGSIGIIKGEFNEEFKDELDKGLDLTKTLFVNVWDPHSMLGNGNRGDRSGRFGKRTAISLLCWSGSNPDINNNIEYVGKMKNIKLTKKHYLKKIEYYYIK